MLMINLQHPDPPLQAHLGFGAGTLMEPIHGQTEPA